MSDSPQDHPYVSRGGLKLAAALAAFEVPVEDAICADLGSHVGGFVDCLLKNGAARVYSVDTSYGTLAWTLRKDDRVVVMERTNALHVTLPEPVGLVTLDVGWTRQSRILPVARGLLSPDGSIISLIKPHYEADKSALVNGVLPAEQVEAVVGRVLDGMPALGLDVRATVDSPITGHGGNREILAWLRPGA